MRYTATGQPYLIHIDNDHPIQVEAIEAALEHKRVNLSLWTKKAKVSIDRKK